MADAGAPAGDTAREEIEAVALAISDNAGHASTSSYAYRLAEAAIAALDRVRADSARDETHTVTPEMVYEVAYAWCRKLGLPLMSPPRAPEAIGQLGHEIERLRSLMDGSATGRPNGRQVSGSGEDRP